MIRKLLRQELLFLIGFGFLTAGAWIWLGLAAGLAAVGISLLAFDFALGDK
jgi:hypothetical protein